MTIDIDKNSNFVIAADIGGTNIRVSLVDKKGNILASNKFEETGEDFYQDKITLSKFYIEQLLPLSSGYASSVTAGKEDLYNLKAESF